MNEIENCKNNSNRYETFNIGTGEGTSVMQIINTFEEVTKQYGDLVVLDKLNLDIKKNEMVSIIGPSGSGKTTVLRVLMTLEKINGGVIHLDGEPHLEEPPPCALEQHLSIGIESDELLPRDGLGRLQRERNAGTGAGAQHQRGARFL